MCICLYIYTVAYSAQIQCSQCILRVYVSSLIPEIKAEERASMSCLNAFSCVLFQTNVVFFLVKSRRGAVIVAKFGMYFDLLFAIPKRLRTSETFVSFDAFLSALMRLGSGWHPSFEKIWPKNSRVSRIQESQESQEFAFASIEP